jgi:cobalt-zinc-cadmium efflux system membrane fusion protein
MFKIVDTKHLHAEITVYEKDVLKIKIDQRVRFQLANETTERIARVYLVGKEISPDRTVRVHCHLEKEDTDLLPGMYLNALFETSVGNVPSLPEQAVINFEGADYVFITKNETDRIYKMIKVTKGVTESGYSEITLPQGIDPSSMIVTEGAYDLLAYLKNTEEE